MKKNALLLSMIYFLSSIMMIPTASANNDVRVAVGQAAGGISDSICREFWKDFTQNTGTNVNILNRPGAEGVIAWRTLVSGETNAMCLGASDIVFSVLDAGRDNPLDTVEMVGQLVELPASLLSGKYSNIKNAEELKKVSNSQSTPMKVGYVASVHLRMIEHLAKQHGFNFIPVRYQSAQQALPELISGSLDFWIDGGSLLPHTKPFNPEGKLNPIAWNGPAVNNHSQWNNNIWFNLSEQISDMKLFRGWVGIAVHKDMPEATKQSIRAHYAKTVAAGSIFSNLAAKYPNVVPIRSSLTDLELAKTRADLLTVWNK